MLKILVNYLFFNSLHQEHTFRALEEYIRVNERRQIDVVDNFNVAS